VLQQIKPDVRPIALMNLLVYLIVVAVIDLFLFLFYAPINALLSNFGITLPLVILVLDLFIIFVALLRVTRLYWYKRFHTYIISDDSLTLISGVISKREFRIPYNNISTVEVITPFSLRVFGLGLIQIETNDRNRHFLHFIKDPKNVADSILSYVSAQVKQTKDMAETLRRIEEELRKENKESSNTSNNSL
jgi:uncharacterized membrane protein YdbT with pleckstrin-like domain